MLKKNKIIFLLFFIILIIILTGGFFVLKKKLFKIKEVSQEEIVNGEQKDSWETYISNEENLKFRIKYPNNWKTSKTIDKTSPMFFFESSEKYEVCGNTKAMLTILKIATGTKDFSFLAKEDSLQEEILLDNLSALKLAATANTSCGQKKECSNCFVKFIEVIQKEKNVKLEYTIADYNEEKDQSYEEIFNKIIESFKFL